jgi:hypothetical protein
MSLDLSAIQSAAVSAECEASLTHEELAVLACCILLSEPHGYFVDAERHVKWSYQGLLQYIFSDMYLQGLMRHVDEARLILDASVANSFHEQVSRRNTHRLRLTPPEEAEALITVPGIFTARHADLLQKLRNAPLMTVISNDGDVAPEAASTIVRFCLYLSPEDRQIVKWMATAYDSPIMQLMTRFGYMAEERRLTITSLLANPSQLSEFEPQGDRTYRKFIQLYRALEISQEENALLIFIGRSEHLADLGRRLVRMPSDRREMVARML